MSKSGSPQNNLEESDNTRRGCRQESSVKWLVTLKCLRCLQMLVFFFNYLWRRHHVQTWINITIYAFVTSHVGECFNQKSITDDHFPPWPVSFSVFVPWRTNVSLYLCFRVFISWCHYVFLSWWCYFVFLCLLTTNSHLGEYPRIFFHCFEIFVLDWAIATPSKWMIK